MARDRLYVIIWKTCPITGYGGLHLAAIAGQATVLQLLLDRPDIKLFDEADDGDNALELASRAGKREAVCKIVRSKKFKY